MSLFQQDACFWRLVTLLKALAVEDDPWQLLQQLMSECQNITHCDGGTLYLVDHDSNGAPHLLCTIVQNETLKLHQNYRFKGHPAIPPIQISPEDSDHEKTHSLAAYCAINGLTTRVDDIYGSEEFNTQGVQSFDKLFSYRTRSVLSVPIMNSSRSTLGVIQLINPMNPLSGTVAHYSDRQVSIVEGLAALMGRLLTELDLSKLSFKKAANYQ